MKKMHWAIILWSVVCGMSMAQTDSIATIEENIHDNIKPDEKSMMLDSVVVESHRRPLLTRMMMGVNEFFMGCDTNYVTPQKYQLTAQAELSYWHDYYFLRSSETGNTMVIQSDPSVILGGYIYYSILGYGAVWNLNDIGIKAGKTNGTSLRQTFMIHTAKFFAEYYTFNSGKGAEIRRISGLNLKGLDKTFHGLDSRCNGVSAVYLFNNRHFSWPAAFGENAVQRKSCGSWSVGFQYNHQRVTFDKDALPDYLEEVIDTTLLFTQVNYDDYNINIGYSYNCVIGRNILYAISLMPSIGYRRSNITEAQEEKHSFLNNVSTDLNLRMSFFWNNTRLFSGLILEAHTYSYRKNKFGLTNTYGTIKYVLGFNFWKKPEYRKRNNTTKT
ncbi:MAG: DUF4421 domain-containing protein [Bacteroidaceae bacterium]|nr:DUF4421 domain-containing protein [Bacteroidaceae bacterium]